MDAPAHPATRKKARNPLLRGLYLVLGLVCLGLIPLSYLPGIPTFDLVLLAAFFFSMSSDRLHDWMLGHPYFGRIIRGYRHHGLTMRMKWAAAVAISLSLGVSAGFLTDNGVIRVVLFLVWGYAIWFVFSRPTRDPATT